MNNTTTTASGLGKFFLDGFGCQWNASTGIDLYRAEIERLKEETPGLPEWDDRLVLLNKKIRYCKRILNAKRRTKRPFFRNIWATGSAKEGAKA